MTTETKIKILLFNNKKILSPRDVNFCAANEWYIEDTERTERLLSLIHCYEPIEVSQEELDAIKLMRHPYIILVENAKISDVLYSIVSSAKEYEKELERQKQLQKEKEEKAKQKSKARKKNKEQKLLRGTHFRWPGIHLADGRRH